MCTTIYLCSTKSTTYLFSNIYIYFFYLWCISINQIKITKIDFKVLVSVKNFWLISVDHIILLMFTQQPSSPRPDETCQPQPICGAGSRWKGLCEILMVKFDSAGHQTFGSSPPSMEAVRPALRCHILGLIRVSFPQYNVLSQPCIFLTVVWRGPRQSCFLQPPGLHWLWHIHQHVS